jgi:hypothetical protein
MSTNLDEIIKDIESIVGKSQPYEMPIYGNRAGDNAARQPKLGNALPGKPGVSAGNDQRVGDQVPCRDGDIIAGVCKTGQTARDVEMARQADISMKFMMASMNAMRENATKQLCLAIQASKPSTELAPCP